MTISKFSVIWLLRAGNDSIQNVSHAISLVLCARKFDKRTKFERNTQIALYLRGGSSNRVYLTKDVLLSKAFIIKLTITCDAHH